MRRLNHNNNQKFCYICKKLHDVDDSDNSGNNNDDGSDHDHFDARY